MTGPRAPSCCTSNCPGGKIGPDARQLRKARSFVKTILEHFRPAHETIRQGADIPVAVPTGQHEVAAEGGATCVELGAGGLTEIDRPQIAVSEPWGTAIFLLTDITQIGPDSVRSSQGEHPPYRLKRV